MSQNKIYKYYSTMRYLDIGTFPKDCFELKNYETRKQVLPGIMAWGEVTYTRKLTEKELKDYLDCGVIYFGRYFTCKCK